MRSLKTRLRSHGEDNLRRRALLWHLIPVVPLRPHASRSKLSSSHVVPTVQPSNMATNAKGVENHTQLMLSDRKFIIVPIAMLLDLPELTFHQEAENMNNGSFEVLCKERAQYNQNRAN